MTREKKEILKALDEIQKTIDTDTAISYGIVPSGAHDDLCEESDKLLNRLAQLRHYGNAMEMYYDQRGQQLEEEELPFV